MDTLVEYGKNFGLTREETRKTLFLQRPELESLWAENGGSGSLGFQLLESRRNLEYECYDDQTEIKDVQFSCRTDGRTKRLAFLRPAI